jgi:hypothetical protein
VFGNVVVDGGAVVDGVLVVGAGPVGATVGHVCGAGAVVGGGLVDGGLVGGALVGGGLTDDEVGAVVAGAVVTGGAEEGGTVGVVELVVGGRVVVGVVELVVAGRVVAGIVEVVVAGRVVVGTVELVVGGRLVAGIVEVVVGALVVGALVVGEGGTSSSRRAAGVPPIIIRCAVSPAATSSRYVPGASTSALTPPGGTAAVPSAPVGTRPTSAPDPSRKVISSPAIAPAAPVNRTAVDPIASSRHGPRFASASRYNACTRISAASRLARPTTARPTGWVRLIWGSAFHGTGKAGVISRRCAVSAHTSVELPDRGERV